MPNVLADFLKKNKTVVKNISIYEYEEELHIKTMMEIGREEGYEAGGREGLETGNIIAYNDARLSISDISDKMNLTKEEIDQVRNNITKE